MKKMRIGQLVMVVLSFWLGVDASSKKLKRQQEEDKMLNDLIDKNEKHVFSPEYLKAQETKERAAKAKEDLRKKLERGPEIKFPVTVAQRLIQQIALHGGLCSQEEMLALQELAKSSWLEIPDVIKIKSAALPLFGFSDVAIDIEHIINMQITFKKVQGQEKYEIILSGGHFNPSIESLVNVGLLTIISKTELKGGFLSYILRNNANGSEFYKSVFPLGASIEQVVDIIVNSRVESFSEELTVLDDDQELKKYTIHAENNLLHIRTKNILKESQNSHALVLTSSYPVL